MTRLWLSLGLLLWLSACRAAPMPASVNMPDVPASVNTSLGPVAVRLVPDLMADSTKVWGVWYVGDRTILLEAKAPRWMRWLVLFHELCHVAYEASGLAYLTPPQHQEATCDAIASQRMRERFG